MYGRIAQGQQAIWTSRKDQESDDALHQVVADLRRCCSSSNKCSNNHMNRLLQSLGEQMSGRYVLAVEGQLSWNLMQRYPAIITQHVFQRCVIAGSGCDLLNTTEFGGTEDENIKLWIQQVDKIAQIHRTSDDVMLLTAPSGFVKAARKWFNF